MNMYPNNQFYVQDLQNMKDRIDNQIRQMQQQNQFQVPQPITQNFQLASNVNNNELEGRYANNIDEVKNTFVMKTGIFSNKDFSTIWVKDVTGNIRIFKTEEIIEIDEKDKMINDLKEQIQVLKGEVENAKSNITVNDEAASSKKPSRISGNK